MAFNIENFRANITKEGYLPSNKFELYLTLPNMFRSKVSTDTNKIGQITESLKYRINNVKAPGINILNIDTMRYGVGPTQKMPFGVQFEDLAFSIILDKGANLLHFWYDWYRSTVNYFPDTRAGSYFFAPYYIEYKENYTTMGQMIVYNHFNEPVIEYNFYDLFPVLLKETEYTWDQGAPLINLEISMNYKEFDIVNPNNNNRIENTEGPLK